MTLILTELSEAGVAMVADSAITYCDSQGRLLPRQRTNWSKLLLDRSIGAGVSYWGAVGAIVKQGRFDEWLDRVIRDGEHSDLSSLADRIAASLNHKCSGRPLPDTHWAGVHVAGYAPWDDGIRRPTLFHVHNGHGHIVLEESRDVIDGKLRVTNVEWRKRGEPRKLFESYCDFPKAAMTPQENLNLLKAGYLTRNGDYLVYALISERLSEIIAYLNLIPDVSIPRNPSRIESRMGYLLTIADFLISVYGCSSVKKTIGWPLSGLGIRADGKCVQTRSEKARTTKGSSGPVSRPGR